MSKKLNAYFYSNLEKCIKNVCSAFPNKELTEKELMQCTLDVFSESVNLEELRFLFNQDPHFFSTNTFFQNTDFYNIVSKHCHGSERKFVWDRFLEIARCVWIHRAFGENLNIFEDIVRDFEAGKRTNIFDNVKSVVTKFVADQETYDSVMTGFRNRDRLIEVFYNIGGVWKINLNDEVLRTGANLITPFFSDPSHDSEYVTQILKDFRSNTIKLEDVEVIVDLLLKSEDNLSRESVMEMLTMFEGLQENFMPSTDNTNNSSNNNRNPANIMSVIQGMMNTAINSTGSEGGGGEGGSNSNSEDMMSGLIEMLGNDPQNTLANVMKMISAPEENGSGDVPVQDMLKNVMKAMGVQRGGGDGSAETQETQTPPNTQQMIENATNVLNRMSKSGSTETDKTMSGVLDMINKLTLEKQSNDLNHPEVISDSTMKMFNDMNISSNSQGVNMAQSYAAQNKSKRKKYTR